jgi:diamine N-acetyltransferase
MAIDKAEQGRGYGSEALDRILEFIRTKPFGDSDRVALTCHGDNQVALRLYAKKGFEATGDGYYESCVLDADGNRVEITV